jgi:hypothetical protein
MRAKSFGFGVSFFDPAVPKTWVNEMVGIRSRQDADIEPSVCASHEIQVVLALAREKRRSVYTDPSQEICAASACSFGPFRQFQKKIKETTYQQAWHYSFPESPVSPLDSRLKDLEGQ